MWQLWKSYITLPQGLLFPPFVGCLVNFLAIFCEVYILCLMWPLKFLFHYISGKLVIWQRFFEIPGERKQNKTKTFVDRLWIGTLLHCSALQFTVLAYLSLPTYSSYYLLPHLSLIPTPRIFNLTFIHCALWLWVMNLLK